MNIELDVPTLLCAHTSGRPHETRITICNRAIYLRGEPVHGIEKRKPRIALLEPRCLPGDLTPRRDLCLAFAAMVDGLIKYDTGFYTELHPVWKSAHVLRWQVAETVPAGRRESAKVYVLYP